MIGMTSVELMQQMRVRDAVDVCVQINSKKASFRLCQHELNQSRTQLKDALDNLEEVVEAIENGESKFAKQFHWNPKEKEFQAVKK